MDNQMPDKDSLYVKSHVARDLLQNASLFKTDKLVIWEYVSNGLQYIDEGTSPVVKVILNSKKKQIVIMDNGRGMDWKGLQNFFIMHGENLDRKQGKPGRGRFGTGKSAAFGIADILRITTIRNGKRSKIVLHRNDIETINSEDPIPLTIIEAETTTNKANGTMIEIENIYLKSLDQAGVIHYIERHLAQWRHATVYVNNHECEFAEPPVVETKIIHPEDSVKEKIGDVELIIKITGAPIADDELRGVSIYSKGVWHETTLAGHQGREMAQYIFGAIDVPKLEEDKSPISPFDLSRSMQLNPNNETVRFVYAFIGNEIDKVRRQLVKQEKQRRASEESEKLARQAETIARVINEDFDDFRQRVIRARAKGRGGFDYGPEIKGGEDLDDLIFGSEEPAEIIELNGELGSNGGTRTGGTIPRELEPQVTEADTDAEKKGRKAGGIDKPVAARGGFSVDFKSMGAGESRANYDREVRTIYINLDHPQLEAAKGFNSTDDPYFQKITYEIAFSEYAIALAAELNSRDEYIDPSDPIIAIRETINRIARKAASMFSV